METKIVLTALLFLIASLQGGGASGEGTQSCKRKIAGKRYSAPQVRRLNFEQALLFLVGKHRWNGDFAAGVISSNSYSR